MMWVKEHIALKSILGEHDYRRWDVALVRGAHVHDVDGWRCRDCCFRECGRSA